MKTDKVYWFGPKRFGVGFGPRTWQGWTATCVYVLLMLVLPRAIEPNGGHTVHAASMVILTVAFLVLFFWKLDTSKR